jgi:hypothetical protein
VIALPSTRAKSKPANLIQALKSAPAVEVAEQPVSGLLVTTTQREVA